MKNNVDQQDLHIKLRDLVMLYPVRLWSPRLLLAVIALVDFESTTGHRPGRSRLRLLTCEAKK